MFQSAGLFKDVSCPYFLYGLCERPHCHFKHSKQEESKARKEAEAGKKETETDEGYTLPTSSLQRTLQAIEDNIKSEKQKLTTKDAPEEENHVKKPAKKPFKNNKPTGTPEYNPTPIQELKKKESEGKLGRSKYDLALLQKPKTDSEYDPECNYSTNNHTVPDYAKTLHGVKRTADENDDDEESPPAKIPKFVSVEYTPTVTEAEESDEEPIGEKEDWFSENESVNSNDSGNLETVGEKFRDKLTNADDESTDNQSLPIEFTADGFVKYTPTKIDNKKKVENNKKSDKSSLNHKTSENKSKQKNHEYTEKMKKENDKNHSKTKDTCNYNIFSLFKNEFDKVFEAKESSNDKDTSKNKHDKPSDKPRRTSSDSDGKNKSAEKKSKDSQSDKHLHKDQNNHKHHSKDRTSSHSSGSKHKEGSDHRSSSKEKSVTSNHSSSSSKQSSSSSKQSSSSSKQSSCSLKQSSSSSKQSSSSSKQTSSTSKHSSSKHSSSSSTDKRSSSSSSKHDKQKDSKHDKHNNSKHSSSKRHSESDSKDKESTRTKPHKDYTRQKKSIVNLDVDLFGEDVLNMSSSHYDSDMSDLDKYFEDEDPFEECLRIFNEDKDNDSAKSRDKKKSKKSSTSDKVPDVVVGKKRIALKENEEKVKRQKVDDKPKPKPSPAQVMMNRYKMMQERALQVEQERKEKVKAKVKEMQAGRMANPPPPVAGPNIAGSISTFATYMNNKNKKTTAITVAKGAKRKAHTTTVEIEKLKRPVVEVTSSSKVPANVRQRYLNMFIDECIKLCPSEREAYDKGKAEEEAVFKRCTNKKIYLNIAVNTIKRLRREIEEKKANKAPKKEKKLSHAAMLGGAHAANTSFTLNRSGGAVKLREEDFDGAELYKRLKPYILTEDQLNVNNFPRSDPTKGGCAVYLGEVNNTQKGSVKGYEKICIRCGKRFEVYPNGKYPKKDECVYHWGKAWKKKIAGAIDTRYTCCSGDLSSEGCQVAKAHVHDTNKKENLSGFMKTIPCSPPVDGDYGVYAMDCEMVYTTMGMELARVTVVGGDGEVAYESLVQPDNPVVDCNTRFSGITDADLEDVHTSLRDVQAVLLSLFTDKTILMGHSLESDLTALKLIHSTVVDTSLVFPHRMGLPYKRALRNLMIEYLKKIIQDDVAGHDSHEDALACIQLMQHKLKEDARKDARRLSS